MSSIPFNTNGLPHAAMLCEHPTTRHDTAKIAVALHEASVRAKRLRRNLRIQAEDEEDFQQALLLELLTRSRKFDETRSAWATFTWTVMRNAEARLRDQYGRDRPIMLPLARACDVVGETINANSIHVAIDFRRALQSLPPDLVRFAEETTSFDSITEAQRASPLPKCSFYRRLRELRLALLAAGACLEAGPQFTIHEART